MGSRILSRGAAIDVNTIDSEGGSAVAEQFEG